MLTDLRAQGVHAPIIVITAYADVAKVKFALNEGAAHLLEKPFRAAELVAAIERVRSGGNMHRAAEGAFARFSLTGKERAVALHLLDGLTYGDIAEAERNSAQHDSPAREPNLRQMRRREPHQFFRLVYEALVA